MRQILGFYHVCLVENWKNIVKSQVKRILKSGLYDKTDRIYTSCLGQGKHELRRILPPKFEILIHNPNIKLAEIPILQSMQNYAKNNEFFAWYIHTKGVISGRWNVHVNNWRTMMEYFIIDRHDRCLKIIQRPDCDACGIEVRTDCWDNLVHVKHKPFFLGNFWWSKSEYLKILPNLTQKWHECGRCRHIAESFLGLLPKKARLFSFYNSNLNPYAHTVSHFDYQYNSYIYKLINGKLINLKTRIKAL